MNLSLDFSRLLPDFSLLLQGKLYTMDGVSALFIAILLAVTITTALYILRKLRASLRAITSLEKLSQDTEPTTAFIQRRDIDQAVANDPRIKPLRAKWQEFSAGLMADPNQNIYLRSADPELFFHGDSAMADVSQNRVVNAIPGTLTAIGVIGTFLGLQIGLSQLNIGGDLDFQGMRQGIGNLIQGASLAFLTSLWGVFTSLLIGLWEKIAIRWVDRRSHALCQQLTLAYPAFRPEKSLWQMEQHGSRSSEALAHLGETIGHQLQKAISDSNESFRKELEHTLKNIMAPAVEALVNHSQDQSQKALTDLMERFMESMGGAGEQQKELMLEVTEGIKSAVESMDGKLQGFLAGMDDKTAALTETMAKSQTQMEQRINDQLMDVTGKLDDSGGRLVMAAGQVEGSFGKVAEIGTAIEANLSRWSEQIDRTGAVQQEHLSAIKGIHQSLNDASLNLRTVSEGFSDLQTFLGEDFKGIVAETGELAQQQQQFHQHIGESLQGLKAVSDEVRQTIDVLQKTGTGFESSFTKLEASMQKFLKQFKVHVKTVEEDLLGLLKGYGEHVQSQTNERLGVWNDQTSQYLATMTDAIQSISDVVDDIDGKVQGARSK